MADEKHVPVPISPSKSSFSKVLSEIAPEKSSSKEPSLSPPPVAEKKEPPTHGFVQGALVKHTGPLNIGKADIEEHLNNSKTHWEAVAKKYLNPTEFQEYQAITKVQRERLAAYTEDNGSSTQAKEPSLLFKDKKYVSLIDKIHKKMDDTEISAISLFGGADPKLFDLEADPIQPKFISEPIDEKKIYQRIKEQAKIDFEERVLIAKKLVQNQNLDIVIQKYSDLANKRMELLDQEKEHEFSKKDFNTLTLLEYIIDKISEYNARIESINQARKQGGLDGFQKYFVKYQQLAKEQVSLLQKGSDLNTKKRKDLLRLEDFVDILIEHNSRLIKAQEAVKSSRLSQQALFSYRDLAAQQIDKQKKGSALSREKNNQLIELENQIDDITTSDAPSLSI